MLHVHLDRVSARKKACAPLLFGVLIAVAPVDLGHDSSTAVLQSWREAHGPPGLKITALHDPKAERAPSEAARKALDLKPGQSVRYRRVRLACGQTVLSEADNWYLPERLTPQMNHTLETSDAPFGAVVRALDFRRRFLSADLLWKPLPEGWEKRAPDPAPPGPIPAQVLTDTAVLATPDGRPFSFVAETYTAATLEMALPR